MFVPYEVGNRRIGRKPAAAKSRRANNGRLSKTTLETDSRADMRCRCELFTISPAIPILSANGIVVLLQGDGRAVPSTQDSGLLMRRKLPFLAPTSRCRSLVDERVVQ